MNPEQILYLQLRHVFFLCSFDIFSVLNRRISSINKQTQYWDFVIFKGTVCVNACDSPCKDDNARFTKNPFKALSIQV